MMTRWRLICLSILLAACTGRAGDLTPNDPYLNQSWHISKIGLPHAWSYSTGDRNLIAAILDTGVMTNVPDLSNRVMAPLSTVFPTTPPLDGTAVHHGTWVAGTLGMEINNGIGGMGVGNFKLLPITVTDDHGFNSSDFIADGIRLAADNGARVINVSHYTLNYGRLESAAIYAKSKGALVFVAAGNSDSRVTIIPDEPNLIFVSGTDQNDTRWHAEFEDDPGSSWGPYVDLSAPAVDIIVADPFSPTGYYRVAGTSFAAPLAAGAAALAWSINPNLTPDQVKSLLYSTAKDLGDPGWDEVYGWGRLDVGALADAAAATVPEPATLLWPIAAGLLLIRRRKSPRI
jgi:subtilisin family serine protease